MVFCRSKIWNNCHVVDAREWLQCIAVIFVLCYWLLLNKPEKSTEFPDHLTNRRNLQKHLLTLMKIEQRQFQFQTKQHCYWCWEVEQHHQDCKEIWNQRTRWGGENDGWRQLQHRWWGRGGGRCESNMWSISRKSWAYKTKIVPAPNLYYRSCSLYSKLNTFHKLKEMSLKDVSDWAFL